MGFLDNTGLARVWSKITTALSGKVDKTTTVNGHALSGNVSVTKGDVGLGNVDNTSDANKPISTATQTALNGKVSTSTTVNGHTLSSNVSVTQQDIGIKYSSEPPSNPSDGDIWLQPESASNILHDTDIASSAITGKNTVNAALTQLNSDVSNLNGHIGDLDYSNAGTHNAIYRGKYLGSSVTAEQWAQIKAGTFEDMYIGDYWTINGVNWRIAAFDYWVNANSLSTHHVVIVPDSNLVTSPMNSTNTTAGAYYNSDFRKGNNSNTGRATAITAVNNAFGSSHILTYKDFLHSAVTDGHPSGQEWADCTVELMNEEMVYGAHIFAPIANGSAVYSNYTTSKSQLPLFQHEHSRISNCADWWLRSVVSGSLFARVDGGGGAVDSSAGDSFGVRPAFGIFQS